MSNPRDLLPLLYATDATNGWSRGMRAISHTLLAQVPLVGPTLEVGCGAGYFLREHSNLRQRGLVVGTDQNAVALAYAQTTDAGTHSPFITWARCDLQRLPFADNTFALIVGFDVYDQVGVQLEQALVESRRVLQPSGWLLLRVSAHKWLESTHDLAFHTASRYNRRAITQTLRAAGFAPQRVTHANTLLALPVVVQRLAQRWELLAYDPSVYTSSFYNWVMEGVLQLEARYLAAHNLPFGISLYVLARKDVGNQ
ncbi:MAG: class I SAM-dependent methyltransferase [Caldilineaceae bacterium]|nr:class I SAM-dependent methyltransferase [Caldilineaceae bacterium]